LGPKTIAAERGLAYKGNFFLAGGQEFSRREPEFLADLAMIGYVSLEREIACCPALDIGRIAIYI